SPSDWVTHVTHPSYLHDYGQYNALSIFNGKPAFVCSDHSGSQRRETYDYASVAQPTQESQWTAYIIYDLLADGPYILSSFGGLPATVRFGENNALTAYQADSLVPP